MGPVRPAGRRHTRCRIDTHVRRFDIRLRLVSGWAVRAVSPHRSADGHVRPLGLADGAPVPVFATRVGVPVGIGRQQYDVSADGQRFLINNLSDDATTTPITLLLNWKASVAAK